MAFDFLSYIVDQTQHNTQLFVTVDKLKRKSIISHIVSLQLMHLKGLHSSQLYQILKDNQTEQLAQSSLPETKENAFADHIQQALPHVKSANQQISKILLDELQQLNDNAHLGESGLNELIQGQLPWIQQQAEDWFWVFINQTEHKITKTNKNDSADFNQIMKDFNQIILNKEQSLEHQNDAKNLSLDDITVQKTPILAFLNPIIALIILCFLHNIIL